MYELKTRLDQRPSFFMSLEEIPKAAARLHPPIRKECEDIAFVGMPEWEAASLSTEENWHAVRGERSACRKSGPGPVGRW